MATGIGRAIFGDDIDREAFVNREVLLAAVQRDIFCASGNGAVLDIRTAVMTIFRRGETVIAAPVFTAAIYDAAGGLDNARATADKFSATLEVIDGRNYRADGTLRKEARLRAEALRAEATAQ